MAERCAGSSLDPSLSAVLCDHAGELLERVSSVDAWERVVALEPRPRIFSGDELAQACQVIADYADLKSYGTLGHSRAVAELAEAAGWRLGFDAGAVGDLRCAAWLHDLGRVGVSSAVWEKPGPLTSGEWEQVRLHSYHSERLLARIPAFAELARTAASDHERLDGSSWRPGGISRVPTRSGSRATRGSSTVARAARAAGARPRWRRDWSRSRSDRTVAVRFGFPRRSAGCSGSSRSGAGSRSRRWATTDMDALRSEGSGAAFSMSRCSTTRSAAHPLLREPSCLRPIVRSRQQPDVSLGRCGSPCR